MAGWLASLDPVGFVESFDSIEEEDAEPATTDGAARAEAPGGIPEDVALEGPATFASSFSAPGALTS